MRFNVCSIANYINSFVNAFQCSECHLSLIFFIYLFSHFNSAFSEELSFLKNIFFKMLTRIHFCLLTFMEHTFNHPSIQTTLMLEKQHQVYTDFHLIFKLGICPISLFQSSNNLYVLKSFMYHWYCTEISYSLEWLKRRDKKQSDIILLTFTQSFFDVFCAKKV